MKTFLSHTLAVILIFALLAPLTAFSAQPSGYWPYHVAYNDAVNGGNIDEILEKGDALLEFYSKHEMNFDIAANSFNVYYYRYINSIFEKWGDYAAAKKNLEKLRYVAKIAGIADIDIATEMKARKINTHMDVFALTDTEEHSLHYGALNEPHDGVYYGRTLSTKNNHLANAKELEDESIVSLYVTLGKEKVSDYEWLLDEVGMKKKALQVAYNFPEERKTVLEIISGMHDANIRENLIFLENQDYPVLLRIGAEMNVWTNLATPEEYKQSYIRIANMARSIAPSVALEFSVNCVSGYGDEMLDYYPGDEYVDWVGISLYCNRYLSFANTGDEDFGNMYFGAGDWGEPVASAAEVIEKFGDRKPIIISEGGVGHHISADHADLTAYASDRVYTGYRTLTMVYPQIKGIVYFDANVSGSDYEYDLEASPEVSDAYEKAGDENKTLLHRLGTKPLHYVPLDEFCDAEEQVMISAYCYAHYSGNVYVDYYLDEKLLGRGVGVANELTLDTSSLDVGTTHTFTAVFSNGSNFNETKKYRVTRNAYDVIDFDAYDEEVSSLNVSSWAEGEVNMAYYMGLLPSFLMTDFNAKITREEFCMMIMSVVSRSLGMDNGEILRHFGKTVKSGVFTDTKNEDALVANAIGILNGRGNGIFDPHSSITRQEAATMLYNTAKLLEIEGGEGTDFADIGEVAAWAKTAVGYISSVKDALSGNAVMGGVGNNSFAPLGSYTKEQAILTMVRLFNAQ